MKHTNNLARRLTDIKVSILKLMIDNLDEPITVKKFKIKHKDLFDELVRLEKLLEEKNSMRYKETEDEGRGQSLAMAAKTSGTVVATILSLFLMLVSVFIIVFTNRTNSIFH